MLTGKQILKVAHMDAQRGQTLKSSPASADSPADFRHLAGLVIGACEEELGIKIWPEDSDALSELLDRCEEAIENDRAIKCG